MDRNTKQTPKSSETAKPTEPAPEMSPQLQQKLEQIREKLSIAESTGIIPRYEAGQHVAELKKDRRAFGEGAVEAVASKLQVSAPSLYRYAEVAEAFTQSEVQDVVEFDAGHQKCITWSHLVEAARLPEATRYGRLKDALENGRSSRKIAAEAKAAKAPRNTKPTAAKTVANFAKSVKLSLACLEALKQVARNGIDLDETVRAALLVAIGDAEKFAAICKDILPTFKSGELGAGPVRAAG